MKDTVPVTKFDIRFNTFLKIRNLENIYSSREERNETIGTTEKFLVETALSTVDRSERWNGYQHFGNLVSFPWTI